MLVKLSKEIIFGLSLFFFFIFSFLCIHFYEKRLNANIISENKISVEIILFTDYDNLFQLFYSDNNSFTEDKSIKKVIKGLNKYQKIQFNLPKYKKTAFLKKIRLDLGNQYINRDIKIKTIKIVIDEKELLWKAEDVKHNISFTSLSITNCILEKDYLTIKTNNSQKKYDPYINFKPFKQTIGSVFWLWIILISGSFIGLVSNLSMNRILDQIRYYKGFEVKKILEFSIILIIITLLFRQKWNSIAIGFFSVMSIIFFIKNGNKWNNLGLTLYIFPSLFLIRVIGLFYTEDLKYGFHFLEPELSFVIFPIIFSLIYLELPSLIRIFKIYLYFMLIIACFSIVSLFFNLMLLDVTFFYYLKNIKIFSHVLFSWSYYNHPTFLSIYIIYGLVISLYLFYKKRVSKILMISYVIISLSFVIISGSRIAMVIYFVVSNLAIFAFLFNKNIQIKYKILKYIYLLLLVIFAAYILEIGFKKLGFHDESRIQMWYTSWQTIKENPFFGVGTGGSKKVVQSEELAEKLEFSNSLPFNHPHNQFINELTQFGVFGSSFLMYALFLVVKNSIRKKDYLLINFIVIQLLLMISEAPLNSSKGIIFFMFFISILLLTQKERKLLDWENA